MQYEFSNKGESDEESRDKSEVELENISTDGSNDGSNDESTNESTVHVQLSGKDYENKCRICLDDVDPHDPNVYCPCECANYIHGKCFNQWLKIKPKLNECDVCKTPFKTHTKLVKRHLTIKSCIPNTDHCNKSRILLTCLVLFLYTCFYVIPYAGYQHYENILPDSITIQEHNGDSYYNYVPFELCTCRTEQSNDQNTICYKYIPPTTKTITICHNETKFNETYCLNAPDLLTCYNNTRYIVKICDKIDVPNNETAHDKCINPKTMNVSDIQNAIPTLCIFIPPAAYYLIWPILMLLNQNVMSKFMRIDTPIEHIFRYYVLLTTAVLMMFLSIGTVILVICNITYEPRDGIYNYNNSISYPLIALSYLMTLPIMYNYTATMFSVVPNNKTYYSIIILLSISIVFEILCHLLGMFVTNVVLSSLDTFKYEGWKYPNMYNYLIGIATCIGVFVVGYIIGLCVNGTYYLIHTCAHNCKNHGHLPKLNLYESCKCWLVICYKKETVLENISE